MQTVDFSGELNRELQLRVLNGLAAAGTFMCDSYRIAVGVNNPTYKSRKYKRKSKSGAKSHTFATAGAPPGSPPYARTHQGQLSIQAAQASGRLAWQVGVRAIAGSEKNYMLYLDALRWPWIEPTFNANLDAARQQFIVSSQAGE